MQQEYQTFWTVLLIAIVCLILIGSSLLYQYEVFYRVNNFTLNGHFVTGSVTLDCLFPNYFNKS